MMIWHHFVASGLRFNIAIVCRELLLGLNYLHPSISSAHQKCLGAKPKGSEIAFVPRPTSPRTTTQMSLLADPSKKWDILLEPGLRVPSEKNVHTKNTEPQSRMLGNNFKKRKETIGRERRGGLVQNLRNTITNARTADLYLLINKAIFSSFGCDAEA